MYQKNRRTVKQPMEQEEKKQKIKSQIDQLDRDIIKLLEENALRSSTELAKLLHSSDATIRRRVRRLIDNNTISIHAVTNPDKIGFPSRALFGLNVATGVVDSTVQMLFEKPEVIWVTITTGRFNIIFATVFSSNNDLYHFLHAELPAIEESMQCETFICLKALVRPQFHGSVMLG